MNHPSSPTKLPQVGMVLDGFRILKTLGVGGMGAVYQVEKQGAIYALKVILNPLDHDLERFQREAVSLAAARHPNIVRIHTIQASGSWPYILFEFIEGQDLSSKLIPGEPWTLEESLRVLRPLAAALDSIHAKGIVHRDLKPANILIRHSDQEPFLTDFGIAKNQNLDSLTQRGEIVGTASHMAPEQFDGEGICAQTDLWAMGVILYQMLSGGRLPFEGSSLFELAQKIFSQKSISIAEHLPQPPPALLDFFKKAFAKDLEDRYRSGAEFIEDCEKVLRGERIGTPRSGRGALLFALPVFLILVLSALGLLYKQGQDWNEARAAELQVLGAKVSALNDALPLQYLHHCLGQAEEGSLHADFEEVEKLAEALEQEIKKGAEDRFSWKDIADAQRALAKLQPSLATQAFLHSKPAAIELSEGVKYRQRRLLKAALLYRNGRFAEAYESYDSLEKLSKEMSLSARLMKADCAFQLGKLKDATVLLRGIEDKAPWSRWLRPLSRKIGIRLSVEDLFAGAGGFERSRALLESLLQGEERREAFFTDWDAMFQKRFEEARSGKALVFERAMLRRRELSYQFPEMKSLILSEEALRHCLKSAQKRLDKGAALLYCFRIKRLNKRFQIPPEFNYAFTKDGLNYGELSVELHRRIALKRGRLLDQLQFVLEACRQGIYLEGLDDVKRVRILSADRAVLDFIQKDSRDPYRRFWRAILYANRGAEEASRLDDFQYVIAHKKSLGAIRARALTKTAKSLYFGGAFKGEPKDKLSTCLRLLDKARTLPHPRPNVIELLRFQMLSDTCSTRQDFEQRFEEIRQCLDRLEEGLRRRLTLTEQRALERGRPVGQPYARLSVDVFQPRKAYLSLCRGRYYSKLGQFKEALKHFLDAFTSTVGIEALDEILFCIGKVPAFRAFDKVTTLVDRHLRQADVDRETLRALRTFKAQLKLLQHARD